MRLVLTGRNRFVVLAGRWAVKVPSLRSWRDFLFGLLNNLNEGEWATDPTMAHCPVVWRSPGGFILVQRRARILTDQEFVDLHPALPPARAEPKADSWGWLDGRLVAVDYGW
jgi:hypothetical protein